MCVFFKLFGVWGRFLGFLFGAAGSIDRGHGRVVCGPVGRHERALRLAVLRRAAGFASQGR